MIDIKLEPYCQNCKELELNHDIKNFYGYDKQNYIHIYKHVITCKHAECCKNIAEYIKSQILEENTIDGIIESLEEEENEI